MHRAQPHARREDHERMERNLRGSTYSPKDAHGDRRRRRSGRPGPLSLAIDSSPHAIGTAEPPETSASFRMNAQPFGNLLARPHQSVNV